MNALKEYWYKLPQRDQQVLGVGIIFVVSILLYALAWAPLQDQLKRERPMLARQTSDLQWMQSQESKIRLLTKSRSVVNKNDDTPLLTLIDQIARQEKLRDKIKQIQPGKENDTAKIWFDKVIFEDWLKWLDKITVRGIEVTRVSVTKSAEIPLVNIRLEVAK